MMVQIKIRNMLTIEINKSKKMWNMGEKKEKQKGVPGISLWLK